MKFLSHLVRFLLAVVPTSLFTDLILFFFLGGAFVYIDSYFNYIDKYFTVFERCYSSSSFLLYHSVCPVFLHLLFTLPFTFQFPINVDNFFFAFFNQNVDSRHHLIYLTTSTLTTTFNFYFHHIYTTLISM